MGSLSIGWIAIFPRDVSGRVIGRGHGDWARLESVTTPVLAVLNTNTPEQLHSLWKIFIFNPTVVKVKSGFGSVIIVEDRKPKKMPPVQQEDETRRFIEEVINNNVVALFSLTTCPFCKRVCSLKMIYHVITYLYNIFTTSRTRLLNMVCHRLG